MFSGIQLYKILLINVTLLLFSASLGSAEDAGKSMRVSFEVGRWSQELANAGDGSLLPGETFKEEISASKEPVQSILLIKNAPQDAVYQRKLADFLSVFIPDEDIKFVFVEGASPDVSLNFMKKMADAEKRLEVARHFLSAGILSGAEAVNLTADEDFTLMGAEDEKMFDTLTRLRLTSALHHRKARAHLGEAKGVMAVMHANQDRLDEEDIKSLHRVNRTVDDLMHRLDSGQTGSRESGSLDRLARIYHQQVAGELNRRVGQMRLGDETVFLADRSFHAMADAEKQLAELQNQRVCSGAGRISAIMKDAGVSKAVVVASEPFATDLACDFRKKHIFFLALAPTDFPDADSLAGHSVMPVMAQLETDVVHGRRPAVMEVARALNPDEADKIEALIGAVNRVREAAPGEVNLADHDPDVGMAAHVAEVTYGDAPMSPLLEEEDKQVRFKGYVDKLQKLRYSREAEQPVDAATLREVVSNYEGSLKDFEKRQFLRRIQKLKKLWGAYGGGAGSGARGAAETHMKALIENESARESFVDTVHEIYGPAEKKLSLPPFRVDAEGQKALVRFMRSNTSKTGMPLSYKVPKGFWDNPDNEDNRPVDAIIERQVTEYDLSIYDGALWQVALSLADPVAYRRDIDDYTRRLMEGRSDHIRYIRAFEKPFFYGDQKLPMPPENAYFFRIISDLYLQEDPKDGQLYFQDFPNMGLLHHEDWKPITGEQAWAVIIGPLQSAYIKYEGKIPFDSREMELALSILPAIEAMVSPIGGIYHAPHGTYGKDPSDISNENNFSMVAALRMLEQVLVQQGRQQLASRVRWLIAGQTAYLSQFAYDYEEGVFYQGGFFVDGEFLPTRIFAVDCQTWGTIAMGPAWIDAQFGEGAAYRMWREARRRAGYYSEEGVLQGVSFTDNRRVLSIEWTCGAILSTKILADHYKESHPEWAEDALSDSRLMRHGIEAYKEEFKDGSAAYLYANRRFFIPFGWWANPLPSLASTAWVTLLNEDFNPFILGGE